MTDAQNEILARLHEEGGAVTLGELMDADNFAFWSQIVTDPDFEVEFGPFDDDDED